MRNWTKEELKVILTYLNRLHIKGKISDKHFKVEKRMFEEKLKGVNNE